jgi:DNA helicase HerA-like ATPase
MTNPDTGEANEIAAHQTRLLEARRALTRRLAMAPHAHSADGQTFGFVAPVATAIPVGGYVRLRTQTGVDYVGQVTAKDVIEREGPELSIAGDAGLGTELADVQITQTSFRVRLQQVVGRGVLLGRVTADGIAAQTAGDVFEDATIGSADASTVERYLRGRGGGRVTLDIGTLPAGEGEARAALYATGFDRHTFLCGQSGSGKTFALGAILERLLLETDLRIVIIDPNSDFVRLGEVRPFEQATRGFGATLDASGYAELRERYLAATAGLRVLRPARRGTNPANALRVRFGDLMPAVQGMVLQLDPLTDREEFNTFSRIVERFGEQPYSLADLHAVVTADLSAEARRLALRIGNLGVADWDVWADAGEPLLAGITKDDWRALVFDIGGFARPVEKSLVAMGLLNYLWHRREERRPVLVVIDEAHNVCPQEPADRLQAAATERAIQIAGEGRKFGIYLLLSTQRPQKLHTNVLSQSDNLVLMRMNSAGDLAHLATTFSFVPSSLLERSSYFAQGESLLAGKIVPSPLFARFGGRISPEGGSDVPTTWATPR